MFYIEVSTTNFIDGLLVYHNQSAPAGMGSEDRVIGLNYSYGNLGGSVNGELQLGLLARIDKRDVLSVGR